MIIEKYLETGKNVKNEQLNYFIYLPDDYYHSKKKYPLILFLHGAGERGSNIDKIKRHGLPKRIEEGMNFPFVIVAPQCEDGIWWSHDKKIVSLYVLMKKIVSELRIEDNRIYGTGLSMGGYGIIELASMHHKLFAAIIPICGGTIRNKLNNLRDLPMWLFHGDKDDVIPFESSLLIYDYLKKKNENIRITIYENIGHDSWTETYENQKIYNWLLSFKN